MSLFLSGPIGVLLTRLTAARAAFLDAAISSRAAASTALSTATWTSGRATNLDNLDMAITALLGVPTTGGLDDSNRFDSNGDLINNFVGFAGDLGTAIAPVTKSFTSISTWETVAEVSSGSGVISLMSIYQISNASSRNVQVRLTIDSNVVYTSASNLFNATGDDGDGFCIIGLHIPQYGTTTERVPYSSNWKLEAQKDASGTVEVGSHILKYATG